MAAALLGLYLECSIASMGGALPLLLSVSDQPFISATCTLISAIPRLRAKPKVKPRHLCIFSRPLTTASTPSQCQPPMPLANRQQYPIPFSGDGDSRVQTTSVIDLIKTCSAKTHLPQIHARILRASLFQNPYVALSFLSRVALSPPHDTAYAFRVFSQIEHPTAPQYNAMIRACSATAYPAEGFHLYRLMQRRGVRPDAFSSSFVLKSCIKIGSLIAGVQVHARVLRDGHRSDSLLLTVLMDFYSSCRMWERACDVFEEMPRRDTVAWNVLISCCINNCRTRDALGLFELMEKKSHGSRPDDVTCLLLLQACVHLGALKFGEKVHAYLKEQGYGGAPQLCNSLISMYSRCGCLDKAYNVFVEMPERTVVSWSAMISGLAMNGHGWEAIQAFQAMQRVGVAPDEQTLTGVLSACSHSGLVDEGMRFFNSMSEKFGVLPNIHHYGCIVDLLGRAGLLDQAYTLITSMQARPDATIWRTLLGACRIHGRSELGERVIEHIVELQGQEAGDYVLLLAMYSSAGNSAKVAELRRLMKDQGIQTRPGCTSIEVNGRVHEFVADDFSHPQVNGIYDMLREIDHQLKIGGYVPEISSESHDLDAEGKERGLSYHSEKLAIAFGVLVTPPGTTIRVANNLRICVDCHNFVKVLSSVYDRVVLVRDRKRFHHFRHGRCSCNDYW